MAVEFVGGPEQAEFMARVRGVEPGQVLLVPVDVGKSEAMAMVTDLRGEIVTPPFKFALTVSGVAALRARTSAAVEERAAVFCRVGAVRLAEVSPMHLRSLQTELLRDGRVDGKGGLAPRSVAACRRVLSQALKDAVRWGLLIRNPMDAVDPPRVVDAEMVTWSDTQARAFLDAVAGDRLYAMWVLFLTTGVRRGELAGLRWDDVELDRATMAIVRNRVSAGRGKAVSTHQPKTRRGRRNVALDVTSVEVLRRHRPVQLEERMRLGPAWVDSGYVFCGVDGAALHPDTITASFKSIIGNLDVPQIRLHDLRHTSATLALKAGIHPKVVSERFGHATVSITLDLYSHVLDGMQAEAAEQIGAVVFGGSSDPVVVTGP
jgi:integrase